MQYMEWLVSLDHWLFIQINQVWTNSFFDAFFPYITDLFKQPSFKFFIAPALLFYSIYKAKWLAGKIILCTLILFAISDNVNHRVYKPYFERKRPEFTLEKVTLRTHTHSGHSFPSNHASNSFTIFLFLSFFTPLPWLLRIFAALVAYSRVYVGVHFPMDVLVGSLSGALIAYIGSIVFARFLPKRTS